MNTTNPEAVERLIEPMTRAEAAAFADRLADCSPNKMEFCGYVRIWDAYRGLVPIVLAAVGLIRPDPTDAERIAAETGIEQATVERVLSARTLANGSAA